MSKEEKNIIKLLIKSDEAYSTISKHKEPFGPLDNKSLEFHIRSHTAFGTQHYPLTKAKHQYFEFNLFDTKIPQLIHLENKVKIDSKKSRKKGGVENKKIRKKKSEGIKMKKI